MSRERVRILVLEPERGTAEAILRGLGAIDEVRSEVDLVVTVTHALVELAARRYDLLVAKDALAVGLRRVLDGRGRAARPRAMLSVGGEPDPRAVQAKSPRRVPLPLSFNLLRSAVLDALAGEACEADWDEPPLRGTADG